MSRPQPPNTRAAQAGGANHLATETSPYLLQHQYNPVDWYPWCEEALEKARREDKPIFLSIGYAACHWCHVMEHESFEDDEIAQYLNEHFVSIKVDREERPDLDSIYMTAIQLLTRQGGWPMTVFLTPDLRPFYGGTYFPARDRMGMPGFQRVLRAVKETWDTRRDEANQSAEGITQAINQLAQTGPGNAALPGEDFLQNAAEELARSFDPVHGGWGGAPKFPSAPSISLLMRQYAHTGDEHCLHMALFTLKKMAYGGMYDQLGGGFHRYSVDEEWLVPHFEKMLYDNGQLAQVYLDAFQLTGEPLFERVAREIFAYQLRDMTDAHGGFHSSEDADSEGEEGRFYLWNYDEIYNTLGKEDAELFCAYYNVGKIGNFSSQESYHAGKNVLHVAIEPEQTAARFNLSLEELEVRMEPLRKKLFEAREQRVRPSKDDKVLTSWNALMISAMARGYQVLRDASVLEAGRRAAGFILDTMRREDGTLLRSYRQGQARLDGYLDDYAFMVVALLDLYEADFDYRWLREARSIADVMIVRFADESQGGFFMTSPQHTNLIARQKPTFDGSEPSGNAMAAHGLLRLAVLTGAEGYRQYAEGVFRANAEYLREHPVACLKMLEALDFHLRTPREIAIAGPASDRATQMLLETALSEYMPNRVLAWFDPEAGEAEQLESEVPLLRGKRQVDGRPAAYVCENYQCNQPVTDPGALRQQLQKPAYESQGS